MDHLLSWIIVDFQLPIADLDHASIANSIGNRQSEIGNVKGYFLVKKLKGAGYVPPREAARSLQFSRSFSLRFGSGSPLPRNYCLIFRLSTMDASSPSKPPK